MSGIVGHVTYAILAAKAVEDRGLGVSTVIRRHFASYLGGAYLGCDIQTLPGGVCQDSGEEIGYATMVPERSPLTGGEVLPWTLSFEGREHTPREIHDAFYGRSHLILGWRGPERDLALAWPAFLDYAADAAADSLELFGPGHRALAWTLGWITHVVGDGLIKSVVAGLELQLLDGTYTPTNRPVQDLVTYNEIGIGVLGLDWAALLDDLATSPVEAVQRHYMRCAPRQGRLGAHFPEGWSPGQEALLHRVQEENHRYQRIRNPRLVAEYGLRIGEQGEPVCDPALSETAGGLSYPEMLAAAEEARFPHALWQIGELVADLIERLVEREPILGELPKDEGPDWTSLTRRWG